MELRGKRVAILAENNYEDQELWYPYYRLLEAGADVFVVGTGTSTVYASKHGVPGQGRCRGRDRRCQPVRSDRHSRRLGAGPDAPKRRDGRSGARGRRAGPAGCCDLPRRLDALLGERDPGPARYQREVDQGRHGERWRHLDRRRGGAGWWADNCAPPRGLASLHAHDRGRASGGPRTSHQRLSIGKGQEHWAHRPAERSSSGSPADRPPSSIVRSSASSGPRSRPNSRSAGSSACATESRGCWRSSTSTSDVSRPASSTRWRTRRRASSAPAATASPTTTSIGRWRRSASSTPASSSTSAATTRRTRPTGSPWLPAPPATTSSASASRRRSTTTWSRWTTARATAAPPASWRWPRWRLPETPRRCGGATRSRSSRSQGATPAGWRRRRRSAAAHPRKGRTWSTFPSVRSALSRSWPT